MSVESELTRLYREKCGGMDVLIRLTPYEVEHLNNLIGIGMQARRGGFLSQARKEKRRMIVRNEYG